MKRIVTLVVVALSLLVSSTAFAKPVQTARHPKAKAGVLLTAKALKKRPALKTPSKASTKPAARPGAKASKPKLTKVNRAVLRLPRASKK